MNQRLQDNENGGWNKGRRRWLATLALGLTLRMMQPEKVLGQNHAEYRYEYYGEDAGRMRIQTHGVQFDTTLSSKLELKGSLVYDGISGASPIGAPPPLGSDQVPLSQNITDIRRAFTLGPSVRWDRYTVTPQISYSKESDYESISPSLLFSVDFNQKNTTLNLGLSHDFDKIEAFKVWAPGRRELKDNTDFLIGVNQLLSSKTVFTANLSLGYTDGFTADPYKGTFFNIDYVNLGNASGLIEESRPRHRFKQIGFLQLTQLIDPVHASIEPSYRFYHDDFGIIANTVSLTWWQKLGSKVTVGPSVRYYTQTAASFYNPQFYGDPVLVDGGSPAPGFEPLEAPAHPSYYSSDYRLSALHSWTFGVSGHWQIVDLISLDLAFKRYEMRGDDRVTAVSAYPSANVYTAALGIWF